MNEAEARELASEISRTPGWLAYPEEQPYLNRDNQDWWVQAHHDPMTTPSNPYPTLPISSRLEWEWARRKWG